MMNKAILIISLIFFYPLLHSCKLESNIKDREVIESDTTINKLRKKDIISIKEEKPNIIIDCEKCKTELVREIKSHINNITKEQVFRLLCCFDKKCTNNVEFSEFSNEVLFLLLSEHPQLTIEVLAKNESISLELIKNVIENPINDRIDLNDIYEKIENLEDYEKTRESLLQSIKIAIEKYN